MRSRLASRSGKNRWCDSSRPAPAGPLALIAALVLALFAVPAARALPLVVSTASLPDGSVGTAYGDSVVAASGVRPWTWSLVGGSLPAGLTLDGATGAITGTPTTAGTSNFIVLATDAVSDTASRPLSIAIVPVPAPVTDLTATHATSGNDADGTTKILIAFTPPAFAVSEEVYRAPFGGYPRYDDAGGSDPPTPSYPPGPPWVLTAVAASGQTDEPATRDAWSYVAFSKNSAGAVSAVSNKTPSTTNYALGDVSNGVTAGAGDNHVGDTDVSLLGAHYGISGSAITSAGVSYLDVGPTTDLSLASRPFTDNRIDFEDLIVFASNYGAVSSPAAIVAGANGAARAARGPERLSLDAPSHVERGDAFAAVVRLEGHGRIQGLSATLGWDAAVCEPVAVDGSDWLAAQKAVVLSSAPGVVDAVLLGARASGIAGEGTLATVSFRALREGDPALRLASVKARDAANRPLPANALALSDPAAAPSRTRLEAPLPNPAPAATTLAFSLARGGTIELAIYSVDGRRLRTIARGSFAAGRYQFPWAGDDDRGRSLAPGVYYAQLAVRGGPRFARTIVRLP